MRLHEITNTPGDYLLIDFQIENVIDNLLQSAGKIRLSAVGYPRRQPAVLLDKTRVAAARPAARPLPDLLPDLRSAIL
jgi:hypothetical protein